jgi:hypothetical protein
MPNNVSQEVVEEFLDEEDDWSPEDFGFIIGPDGELKTLMVPENLMDDPPEEVKIILELFGITNIHQIDNRTIH